MPRTLPPIPLGVPIVVKDPVFGAITEFYRLQWQNLIDGNTLTPNVALASLLTPQTAAIPTTSAFVTATGGLYRVAYYLRKTVADGVSSSLQMTVGFVDHGGALTEVFPALTTDTASAHQSGSVLIWADATSTISYAIAYASNTPAKMTYNAYVTVELMSS